VNALVVRLVCVTGRSENTQKYLIIMKENLNIENPLHHILNIILTGSAMGIVHVLAGVDHLSALATLSVGSSWRAVKLGIRWGIGHSTGLVLVTIVILLLKGEVNIKLYKKYCDSLVGIFMILLGIYSIFTAIRTYSYSTSFSSSFNSYSQVPIGFNDFNLQNDKKKKYDLESTAIPLPSPQPAPPLINFQDNTTQKVVAFLIGIIHGIAGPGGMLGVVPAVEMKSLQSSILYLTSFTISSTLCMGIFAAIFGEVTRRAGSTSGFVELLLNIFSSVLSIGVGATWIFLSANGTLEEIFE
jgi:ABC-type nickel/cobalt efflux system permease component RcnA